MAKPSQQAPKAWSIKAIEEAGVYTEQAQVFAVWHTTLEGKRAHCITSHGARCFF